MCVRAPHPQPVVPAAVCDPLAGRLAVVVLSEVPVQVVGVQVGLRRREARAAQAALVPRVEPQHHGLQTPGDA